MLSFFPRDVLDDTWDLIESVSKVFTYSSRKYGFIKIFKRFWRILFLAKLPRVLKEMSFEEISKKFCRNCRLKKLWTDDQGTMTDQDSFLVSMHLR